MFDHDGNGVLDKTEAGQMQQWLNKTAGNEIISKREMKKEFGDKSTFAALSNLADQQAQTAKGKEYVETNGNTTTHIYNSSVDGKYSYRYDSITNENGTVATVMDDGTQEIKHKDGSRQTISQDGTIISYDNKGNKTSVIQDGKTTAFTQDGNKSITTDSEGQTITTTELKNGNEVRTDFEYKNGQTIAREFTGSGSDAALSSITVSGKQDGHNVETKYGSEEDMKNNRFRRQNHNNIHKLSR